MLPRELNWSDTRRRFVWSQPVERSVEDELERTRGGGGGVKQTGHILVNRIGRGSNGCFLPSA